MNEIRVVHLGCPALIGFSGPDAVRFLNGQLTQDVRRVVGGEFSLPSCVTDAKGKLQFRVTLTAADPSGVTGVCVTLASTCTTFETVATTPSFSRQGTFTLTTTPGVKAVNVFFRDALGNVSTTPAATAWC